MMPLPEEPSSEMVKRFEPPKARFEFVTKRGDLDREIVVVANSGFEPFDVLDQFGEFDAEPYDLDLVVGRIGGDCHGGDLLRKCPLRTQEVHATGRNGVI